MRTVRNTVIMIAVCFTLFMGNAMQVSAEPSDEKETVQDTRPDYTIYVNTALNCVTVMQPNQQGDLVPVKAMVCSCGAEDKITPAGTFQTTDYYDWRLMIDDTYGRYAVRFYKKILFHSVPYLTNTPDSLDWEAYNLLGQGASHGCVRLSVEDAKWIYDNCKVGTTVVVYADAENPGPLGKPEAIKIDGDLPYRNWDPTDADSNNPWHNPASLQQYPIGSVEQFDYIGYADRYIDVKNAYGYDRDALYAHYMNFGMKEKRIAHFDNYQ